MENLNFAVFGVVEMSNEKIILVHERGNFPKKMWKLPGGRPKKDEIGQIPEHEQDPECVLLREINEEIGLVVEVDELVFLKQIFKKDSGLLYTFDTYDFIVYACKYYSGELKPGAEIERCNAFSRDEILKLISNGEVLPLHAEALKKYIEETEEEVETASHAF